LPVPHRDQLLDDMPFAMNDARFQQFFIQGAMLAAHRLAYDVRSAAGEIHA
jgi:hypothetical protein